MAKQFYRKGADIYEAGTDRYIGATEWAKDWSGNAEETEAPADPVDVSGRTLEGTLTGGTEAPERSLGQNVGAGGGLPLGDFKARLRSLALRAQQQSTPSVGEELSSLAGQGLDLQGANPAVIGQGLELGTQTRTGAFKTAFANIIDIIKQQEADLAERQKKDLAFASSIMDIISKNPTVLASMDAKDFESVKSGVISTELMQKIGQAAATSGGEGLSPLAQAVINDPTILGTLTGSEASKVLGQIAASGNDVSSVVRSYGGLTEEQLKTVNSLNQQFSQQQIVKDFNVITEKKESIENIMRMGVGGPGDLASIFEFMKLLDPTSVVREAEYASAAKSGNIFSGWAAKFNGYLKEEGGFLPESVLRSFLKIADEKFEVKKKQYDNLRSQYGNSVNLMTGKGDGEKYIMDFSIPETGTQGTGSETGTYYNEFTQDGRNYVQEGNTLYLVNPDETLMEVGQREIPKGDEVSAASEAKRVASAIGEFESGGQYFKADGTPKLGPVVTSGQYKGERAIGKYQVMPGNVPSWTKEALGFPLTPDEFANSPEAQDAVAEYRIGRLLAQGYGVEDIASIWFTGSPLAQGKDAKDVLGTKGSDYAKRVREIYDSLS
jgi:hypothetical protein